MNKTRRGPKGRGSALAGIVSFFRQLSLFDSEPSLEKSDTSATRVTAPPFHKSTPSARSSTPVTASTSSTLGGTSTLTVTSYQEGSPPRYPNDTLASFSDLCQGPFAHIRVFPKKRLYESWRVAWVRRSEELRVAIPVLLVDAPVAVKEALLQWAVLVSQRKNRRDVSLRTRRADLENQIREYLRKPQAEGEKLSRAAEMRLARNQRREGRLNPKGLHHDLEAAFLAVNTRYFQGALIAKLTWSSRVGGLSTHSVAQDGKGEPYHLISISRGYDSADVTPEILEGVIHHECLHIAIPPRRENGRRVVHGPDFKLREREYAYFDVWRRWHRDGLPKALRRLRRS